MKQQLVFVHGGEAFSQYEDYLEHLRTTEVDPFKERSRRWYHTLPETMGDDWEVIKPAMPNSGNAKYEEWKIWFERHLPFMRDGVVLMGHSQGGIFLTKYLLENDFPLRIKALFLVASVFDVAEPFGDAKEDGGDFVYTVGDLSHLTALADTVFVYHSKDDFVVPFAQGEKLAKALPGAEFMVFKDKNHFLIEEFPEIIKKIKAL
jgi:predicted alpha/beta hydrolase family esterase